MHGNLKETSSGKYSQISQDLDTGLKTLGWVCVEDNLTVRVGEAGGCVRTHTPAGTPG